MRFVILGEPLAKQSFRYTFSGRKYPDKDVKTWEAQARMQIVEQIPKGFGPYQSKVYIGWIDFVFPPLKSFSKKQKKIMEEGGIILKSTKPDLDNLQKNLYDSCKGLIFIDDSQVCEIGRIRKMHGNQPRIEFEITGEEL